MGRRCRACIELSKYYCLSVCSLGCKQVQSFRSTLGCHCHWWISAKSLLTISYLPSHGICTAATLLLIYCRMSDVRLPAISGTRTLPPTPSLITPDPVISPPMGNHMINRWKRRAMATAMAMCRGPTHLDTGGSNQHPTLWSTCQETAPA